MKKAVLFSVLLLALFSGNAVAQKRIHSSSRLKPQWVKDKSAGTKIGATGLKVVENPAHRWICWRQTGCELLPAIWNRQIDLTG